MMKRNCLIMLSLLLTQISVAQFSPRNVIDEAQRVRGPESLHLVDIDEDSDLDVLMGARFDNQLSWFENDGNGSYGPVADITNTMTDVRDAFGADFDGDGDTDVVAVSLNDNRLVWYRNLDGQGDFGSEINIYNIPGPTHVLGADLDDDGDNDLLVATFLGNRMVWYENLTGNGDFGPEQLVFDSGPNFASIDVGDVDGDNDLDILSVTQDDNINIFINTDGNGNFAFNQTVFSTGDIINNAQWIDIDGDSDLDIVSSYGGDDTVVWLENTDGNGNYALEEVLTSNLAFPVSALGGDMDGDGDIDIVAAGRNDDTVIWFENLDGQGDFSSQIIISNYRFEPTQLAIGDLDGDGTLDIVTTSFEGFDTLWYRNSNGNGDFEPSRVLASFTHYPWEVYVADVDGDNDLDVVSASRFDNKIAWYENKNDGLTFQQYTVTQDMERANFVYAADLDGDNDLDIIAASAEDHKTAWFENMDGQGNFGPPNIITNNNGASTLAYAFAADLDGDGDNDIISAAGSLINWYENLDGQGAFGTAQSVANASFEISGFHADDLDGDGDIDLMSTASVNDQVLWYKNMDGQGNFAAPNIIASNIERASDIYTADFDGDNDPDILTSSLTDGEVIWFENLDGQGSFGPEQIISSAFDGIRAVHADDLDQDGDMDIIAASQNDTTVIWFENTDGQGSFVSRNVSSGEISGPTSIFSGDFNNDNKVDLVISSKDDNRITWFENEMILSVNEVMSEAEVIVTPNPVSDWIHIQTKHDLASIGVYNLMGQELLTFFNTNKLNITSLVTGVYILRIRTVQGEIATARVIRS